jgi:WD40 repeat protein
VDGAARVWDVATGAETARLEHTAHILWAAVGQRGAAIATGDEMGTLRIWRSAPSNPIQAHRDALLAASFDAAGTRLVTSSLDGTAKIWDVNTGRETARLVGHRDAVVWARFSPDGQRIVTASRDGTARLWDPPFRDATQVLRHEGAVIGVEFSPDGTRVVTAYGKGARLWDARNGQQMAEMPHEDYVVSAAFAADGVRLLTASADQTVRISSAFDGRPIGERLHLGAGVNAASFSPDSRRIVTAAEDGAATVWDVSTGAAIPMTIRSGCSGPAIAFHPAGSEVTVGCPEGQLTSYKMATGEVASPAVSDPEWGGLSQLAYGADNRLAIVSGGKVFLRPRSGGAATLLAHKASVESAEMAPSGQMLVTVSADNSLQTWDVRSARPVMTFAHDGPIATAHFSPDSTEVVAAFADGTARILQANTGTVLGGVLQRQGSALIDARISRDGRQLLTLTDGGTARLWDRRGSEIKALPTPSRAIRFSPADDLVLTLQNAPQLWDRSGNAVATLSADVPAMAAEFSRDGRRIVTTNAYGSVVIWDPRTGQRHSEPRSLGDVAAAAGATAMLSPDGQKVAVSSDDGTLRIADVPEGSADDAAALASVLEVLARHVINERGAIVRSEDPARRLADLRADVSRMPPRTLGERVRAWAVHDPATRTITPFRTETVPAYIEAQLGSGDENARREIQRLFPWRAVPSIARARPSAVAPESK